MIRRRACLRLAALAGLLNAAGRHTAPAEQWRIGCYTRPWAEFDLRFALDAIAEAGFRYVGLMTTKLPRRLVISADVTEEEAAQIGAEVRQRGLSIVSVYGGDIPVAVSATAGAAALRRLIDLCAICGSRNLLMGGIGRREFYDAYYAAIADCCEHARARNVEISLKPHGGLNATGPQCRAAVERVNHPSFRIWYDPGNILYYSNGGLDPTVDAPAVAGLVTGMCVKDYEPAAPGRVLLTPGDGRVNFRKLMDQLIAGGFRSGPLVVECLKPGDAPSLRTEARRAREFVERLVGG
ncbi:MAG: sugar phosphate isomerase/epimerase [Kiritimatiellae bacterium]|nr:sugar phosphate isomerase/epimerase [Kiritimatiellia bacterium]